MTRTLERAPAYALLGALALGAASLGAVGCKKNKKDESSVVQSPVKQAPEATAPGFDPFDTVCGKLPLCSRAPVGAGQACCMHSRENSDAQPVTSPKELIFAPGGGVVYRIPVLARLRSGAVVALAQKRYGTQPDPDAGKIEVVYRIRPANSPTWGPEQIACQNGQDKCGPMALALDEKSGELWMLMMKAPGDRTGTTKYKKQGMKSMRVFDKRISAMRGVETAPGVLSFGQAVDITEQVAKTDEAGRELTKKEQPSAEVVGPGQGVQLPDGRLLFSARGRSIIRAVNGAWSSIPLAGSAPDVYRATDESNVVLLNDGRLMRNDRAWAADMKRVFRRAVTRSLDTSFRRWEPWNQGPNNPLTPGHYCQACSDVQDRCPQAWPGGAAACQNRSPGHCHAAMVRYSIGPTAPERIAYSGPSTTRERAGMAIRLSYDEGNSWPVGRRLVAVNQKSGYSGILRVQDPAGNPGLAVLYEHKVDAPKQSGVTFQWANLSWVLCGRTEPLFIGGNPWMGHYTWAIAHGNGEVTYRGVTTDGQPIEIRTNIDQLTDRASVGIKTPQITGVATAEKSQPGVFRVAAANAAVTVGGWQPGAPGPGCDVPPN